MAEQTRAMHPQAPALLGAPHGPRPPRSPLLEEARLRKGDKDPHLSNIFTRSPPVWVPKWERALSYMSARPPRRLASFGTRGMVMP